RARLPALAERAATQQALGAPIAWRQVEPGKQRPVDRHGEELALRRGQHASKRVVTVALVDARILTPPAYRACVPRQRTEPCGLAARAVAHVDAERAPVFAQAHPPITSWPRGTRPGPRRSARRRRRGTPGATGSRVPSRRTGPGGRPARAGGPAVRGRSVAGHHEGAGRAAQGGNGDGVEPPVIDRTAPVALPLVPGRPEDIEVPGRAERAAPAVPDAHDARGDKPRLRVPR